MLLVCLDDMNLNLDLDLSGSKSKSILFGYVKRVGFGFGPNPSWVSEENITFVRVTDEWTAFQDALAKEMFEKYQFWHRHVIWDFIFIFIYCNFLILNFVLFEKHNRNGKKIHIFWVFNMSFLIYNCLVVMNFRIIF